VNLPVLLLTGCAAIPTHQATRASKLGLLAVASRIVAFEAETVARYRFAKGLPIELVREQPLDELVIVVRFSKGVAHGGGML
jgi:hypothetical protein